MGIPMNSPLLSPDVPLRDLEAAREAYRTRDAEASRLAHEVTGGEFSEYFTDHVEGHGNASGDIIKAIVFGGLDGVVTIFAVIAGCVGANITPVQVIIVGIGNLIADAFSMGLGEYISSKAEEEYIQCEFNREQWEIDNYPEGERNEMVAIYQGKHGFSQEDAMKLVDITFKYPKFFLTHMMAEELNILVNDDPQDDGPSPLLKGGAMFCSFGVFGMIPLIGFAGFMKLSHAHDNAHLAFLVTCGLTMVTLFALGVLKGQFANQNPFVSGSTMMLNGALASAFAYYSATILRSFMERHLGLQVLP